MSYRPRGGVGMFSTHTVTITDTDGGTVPAKGTTTVDLGAYRRVGDSIEGFYNYRQSAITGAAAGSTTYLFQHPSSLTTDSNKLPSSTTYTPVSFCGIGMISDVNDLSNKFQRFAVPKSVATGGYSIAHSQTGANTIYYQDNNFFNMNGFANLNFSHYYKIPISGWS